MVPAPTFVSTSSSEGDEIDGSSLFRWGTDEAANDLTAGGVKARVLVHTEAIAWQSLSELEYGESLSLAAKASTSAAHFSITRG